MLKRKTPQNFFSFSKSSISLWWLRLPLLQMLPCPLLSNCFQVQRIWVISVGRICRLRRFSIISKNKEKCIRMCNVEFSSYFSGRTLAMRVAINPRNSLCHNNIEGLIKASVWIKTKIKAKYFDRQEERHFFCFWVFKPVKLTYWLECLTSAFPGHCVWKLSWYRPHWSRGFSSYESSTCPRK